MLQPQRGEPLPEFAGRVEAELRQRGDGAVLLRRMSLGNAIALLIQFALGMIVNLYVSVPARDHGGGLLAAIGGHSPAARWR